MGVLGLGTSVGGDITAEVCTAANSSDLLLQVIVVSSFDDLHQNAAKAKGKIVVYNVPFVTYGQTVQYRSHGAVGTKYIVALLTLCQKPLKLEQ